MLNQPTSATARASPLPLQRAIVRRMLGYRRVDAVNIMLHPSGSAAMTIESDPACILAMRRPSILVGIDARLWCFRHTDL